MSRKFWKSIFKIFFSSKINIFCLDFFYELENSFTVHKKYVGRRIGPTTPPSRLCVVIFPILKQDPTVSC